MATNDTLHVSRFIGELRDAALAGLEAMEAKGQTATRVQHAAAAVITIANAAMNVAEMTTHPTQIAAFLINLGLAMTKAIALKEGLPTSPAVSVDATPPVDLEVVNLQADPPKPMGL